MAERIKTLGDPFARPGAHRVEQLAAGRLAGPGVTEGINGGKHRPFGVKAIGRSRPGMPELLTGDFGEDGQFISSRIFSDTR